MPYECSLSCGTRRQHGRHQPINHPKKGEIKTWIRNDILKSKKAAVEEMAELAKTGENAERMEELKGEIRSLDSRLEALDMADAGKKDLKTFIPDLKKEDRSIIEVVGGPVTNRTWAGMFNQGRKLEVNEEEIRAFRASMNEGVPSSGGFTVPEPLAANGWMTHRSRNHPTAGDRLADGSRDQKGRRLGWMPIESSTLSAALPWSFIAEEGREQADRQAPRDRASREEGRDLR